METDGQRMSATAELIETYRKLAGREIHVGPWLQIDQQRIDDFARVTGDQQWIHIDPQRAAKESPYGTTIAWFIDLVAFAILESKQSPGFFLTQLSWHAPVSQLRF